MVSKIKITFLGTSGTVPSIRRNHTAILLTNNEENILVDCGEGTQRQFRFAGLSPMKVTRLLITHWHGDHVLGIPGLIQTLAFEDYKKTLYIYGPAGTKKLMESLLRTFAFYGDIRIEVEEVEKGKFFENEEFYLESESMQHGIPCNAYVFVKKGQVRIDKDKLKKAGIESGPVLKKLKEGKDIVYKNQKFSAKNLTFRDGDRKISFILDTSFHDNIVSFAKDSDLLICESNFESEMEELAKEYKHMTAKQCGEIAKKSDSKKLILTHLSRRYDANQKKILDEAKKIFKKTSVAKDLDVIEV